VSEPARLSALYEGFVTHSRRTSVRHQFSAPIRLCYLDLDELEDVLGLHPLWSSKRWHPVQVRRSDYGGDPALSLKSGLRRRAESELSTPIGPVRLLAQPRVWGWCFNPIALGFCFSPGADEVAGVVATVTNTPWRERHDYLLRAGDGGAVDVKVPKALHVSPFFPMEQTYSFHISPPGAKLEVSIDVLEEEQTVLRADMRLRRRPLDRAAMTGLLARHPLMSWQVSAGIYAQAARLKKKGAVFHRHPAKAVLG
jgi:DUF1365 family protein